MGEEPVVQLVADLPYPFTYDGTSLTADWVLPDQGFDIGVYHLANAEPVTPVKRKGGCLVSPRRQKVSHNSVHCFCFLVVLCSQLYT